MNFKSDCVDSGVWLSAHCKRIDQILVIIVGTAQCRELPLLSLKRVLRCDTTGKVGWKFALFFTVGAPHVDVVVTLLPAQVKLKDSVVSKLQFFRARDAEIAWIDAKLDLSGTKSSAAMEVDGESGSCRGGNSR